MQDRSYFIKLSLEESSKTKLDILNQCEKDISLAVDKIKSSLKNNKKLMLCGNGGSAADAQHLSN
jgi:D-sedoheptulose 7-phosphate isomerase